jgi:hypothetical protein
MIQCSMQPYVCMSPRSSCAPATSGTRGSGRTWDWVYRCWVWVLLSALSPACAARFVHQCWQCSRPITTPAWNQCVQSLFGGWWLYSGVHVAIGPSATCLLLSGSSGSSLRPPGTSRPHDTAHDAKRLRVPFFLLVDSMPGCGAGGRN